MIRKVLLVIAALSGSAWFGTNVGWAEKWPDQPVRIIVPFAAGGTSDVLGRLIANYLTKVFDHPFIIENRAGGLGMIGTAAVVNARPDGYTLLISSLAANIIGPSYYGNATFDGVRSFTHIAYLGGPPVGLLVHPSINVSTYREFLAWAKTEKEPINFVSSGTGTNGFIFGMALAQKEHLNFNHIPYKGGAPAMLDLLAGRIKVATITFSSGAEQVRSGGVKALGVSTEKRIPDFPDIPTFKELGYDDMVSASWFALSGPLNLPNEIVEKLNREVIKIMQKPEVKKHLAKDAIETRPMTPAQVTAFFESENARWGPVAKTEATKH
jgi:tripartite-type tricarboxylate transporter receptor subunit TctC